jgi:glyoxylase-like metal-dependent hydrolase (beta-lactamase superfamily II)
MKIETITLGSLETNCFIVWDEQTKKCVVIDPGTYEEKLMNFIEHNKLLVTHIAITHGHIDHVGGVKELCEKLMNHQKKPQVVMSKLEKTMMEELAQVKYQKLFFDLDIDVKNGDMLDFGFVSFEAILVPGHTSFSMCFYNSENHIVFVGDTLFYHSIGTEYYYDGPGTDLSQNIVKYLFTLPETTIVYPGHKNLTDIKEEKLRNPYLSDANTVDPWTL